MDERDQKALDDIEEYGCHVLNVMEGDGEPSFTYSIGINKQQNKPDVLIMGLKSELAHSMANNYKNRLLEGEVFEPGKYYSDFLGDFDVCFVKVAKRHFEEYFGWGLWLHDGDDFEVLQMIWPTTDGVWPWNENKSDYYKWAQPILNDDGLLKEI
ncbi:DUF4262 domain-containing protein [Microbulbifer sp. GL-2]|uniref:DUF4262 domain-containing protein n=1 Tax=Microbulbifer sp. GL-2 TaxID=2591606 RepID=UPI001164E2B7|nr:DUF4262 domain-containing protein [Microbulbifer sp. GL-2]BBM00244.1 hypothetical protein GL2_03180 [Microbulbifer sp. GL-2]